MNELIRQLTAVSLAASVLALVVAMFFYWDQHVWIMNFEWAMVSSTQWEVNTLVYIAHNAICPGFNWWALTPGSPGCNCDLSGLDRL